MKTFVDGCEYNFGVFPFSNHETTIRVFDVNGEVVADAYIEHDVEQIFVTWYGEDGERTYGEYPFFEYDGDDEEMVRWMVSCHPG